MSHTIDTIGTPNAVSKKIELEYTDCWRVRVRVRWATFVCRSGLGV
jgi:hypothetical protein